MEYPTIRWARELPDHPAVIVDHVSITYNQLEDRIRNCASWLLGKGVVPGDRVIVAGANSLVWVVAVHALARVGAVHVPIGSRILKSRADEYQRVYAPRIILTDHSTSAFWDQSITVDKCASFGIGNVPAQPLSEIDPEVLHSVVQTSGSEGEPKGVRLSFRNHLASALGSALNLGVRPDDRWLLNLPMDRIGGLAIVIRAAIYGTTVVLHERFDATAVWQALDEDRVTQLSCVATTLRRVLDASSNRRCPDCLRTVMVGGGPVPSALIDESLERGFPVLPTYGLTETSSQIATLSPAAPMPKRHTAGFAIPLAEIEIRDEEGNVVDDSTRGRIHLRGPMVSDTYWRAIGRSENALDSDGWLATNDFGCFDEDGYLQIVGRLDNVIISGGEKIHSEEIENVLMSHVAVGCAVVIAVDDPEWGQRPLAFVELKAGINSEHDQLMNLLMNLLPKHKLPCRIEFLDTLPMLPSGKPDREALRSRYRT